jgi:hypothetical protein
VGNAYQNNDTVGIVQRYLTTVASPIGDAARSLLLRRGTSWETPPTLMSPLSRETLVEQWLPCVYFKNQILILYTKFSVMVAFHTYLLY